MKRPKYNKTKGNISKVNTTKDNMHKQTKYRAPMDQLNNLIEYWLNRIAFLALPAIHPSVCEVKWPGTAFRGPYMVRFGKVRLALIKFDQLYQSIKMYIR